MGSGSADAGGRCWASRRGRTPTAGVGRAVGLWTLSEPTKRRRDWESSAALVHGRPQTPGHWQPGYLSLLAPTLNGFAGKFSSSMPPMAMHCSGSELSSLD